MTRGDEKFPKCPVHGTPLYYHGGKWHCSRCQTSFKPSEVSNGQNRDT